MGQTAVIVFLLLATGVALFAVQNAGPVTVPFGFWSLEMSLVVVILVAAALGAVMASLVSLPGWFRDRRLLRQQIRELETLRVSRPSMAPSPTPPAAPIQPAGHPSTTVWGYGAVAAADKRGLLLHNAPSLTIEAQHNRPVRIKWINDLKYANGDYRPQLLPVDPTLHWANPPGGAAGRDSRPTFTSTPGRYTGPAAHGYPRAWRRGRERRER